MAASVRAEASGVEVSTPRPLFPMENLAAVDQVLLPSCNSYVGASDGRFLVAVRARDPNAPPIRILVNWRALLKR
jgi:hypothetical protein